MAGSMREDHFWSIKPEGDGYSKIVETGGRVQSSQYRSEFRMFCPSLSKQSKEALVSGKLQSFAEACAKLVGFSLHSFRLPVLGDAEVDKRAALDEDEQDDETEYEILGDSDDESRVPITALVTKAHHHECIDMKLLTIEVPVRDAQCPTCHVVSRHFSASMWICMCSCA